jgi:2-C-methyl-D-erythritol 2,4-cyclodiphosphate synthase
MFKTSIGQDSHRFEPEGSAKPLLLGGVEVPGCPGLTGNSDADVILHAVINAVSGISGINILGKIADELCIKKGITDSRVYLEKALDTLKDYKVTHLSLSIEGKRPNLEPHIQDIKRSLAELLSLTPSDIGLTATTGEGLSEFGKGNGVQVFALITVQKAGNKQ